MSNNLLIKILIIVLKINYLLHFPQQYIYTYVYVYVYVYILHFFFLILGGRVMQGRHVGAESIIHNYYNSSTKPKFYKKIRLVGKILKKTFLTNFY